MRGLKDDPTGKGKIGDGKARNKALLGIFAIGLCIGLVISERAYVRSKGQMPKPRQLVNQFASATKKMLTSGAAHIGAILPHTGAPRNELEVALRRFAPDHELLVAVANQGVIGDGMLETFTKGILRAGVKNHMILALVRL